MKATQSEVEQALESAVNNAPIRLAMPPQETRRDPRNAVPI
ncbi:hypothetical protein ACLK2H_05990 [Escherichia coli]